MIAEPLRAYMERLQHCEPMVCAGKITDIVGLTVHAKGLRVHVGDLCYADSRRSKGTLPLEVVGFRNGHTLLMPLGELDGVAPGSRVYPAVRARSVGASEGLLGRVLDSLGRPLDGSPLPPAEVYVPLLREPPHPLTRRRISEPLATGIRSIDAVATCGKGQRVAIMSGSGVGKSKLLGMIARNTNADVNVIALIGERGREVRDFLEADLGEAGLKRSVVVVATSNEPALRRINGAYVATALAEYFRDQGADVLLMMDSVTRFAMAHREVGLAVGEPPTTKGYPPSLYAVLPKLLERAGTAEHGSITGFYTVLVEADDLNDPVGDAVRSIVDGHIALSRDLAGRGHYPPVSILDSVSRLMMDVTTERHRELAARLRHIVAVYRDAEDLVNIGAYVAGSNPDIDAALRLMPSIQSFLRQGLYETYSFDEIERLLSQALHES
jgi:flagellum-specific ATP synthase